MKLKKILTLMCCAVLLVCISVGATVAYLTSQDSVTNTFSVGKVKITLDEQDVDNDTNTADNVNGRDKANAYHLLPSTTYVKDPTVHVEDGSEDSWLFVKVENGIANIEAATAGEYKTIEDQIIANGWTALADVENVYYKEYDSESSDKDHVVFEEFAVSGTVSNDDIATYTNAKIEITAYAIQKQSLATAKDAWTAGGFN
ncbi:MAG: SipW-dependent-type signal peptide-containing protein [Clostridia bacterium]|nr:SipW-dependent-type signal peptide-containing protein [Clostridia bacterium]